MDLTCQFPKGSVTAIYGPSGSGKTTLLRMISGLLRPQKGNISWDNKPLFSSKENINVKPQLRNIGYVFQDLALFPNLCVDGNLKFSNPSNEWYLKITELLELNEFLNRSIEELSGGQKQRVALARALMQKPEILLLDEALSALDDQLRIKLQNDIQRLQKELQLTTIMVSHDLAEIYKLADHVIKIDNGKLASSGSPDNVLPITKNKQALIGKVLKINNQLITLRIDQQTLEIPIQETLHPDITPGIHVSIEFNKDSISIEKLGI